LLKVFIASRDELDIRLLVEKWLIHHVNIVEHNGSAIDKMINKRVSEASSGETLRGRCYRQNGKDQTQNVIKVLRDSAGAMFRWVQMALDYLHDSDSYEEMEDRLEDLPRLPTLFALYEKMYEMIRSDADKAGSAGQKKARAIITALTFLLHGKFSPFG
jgi:hypothetical protein